MEPSVDVRALTENARLSALHLRVLAIAFATAVIDGVDNQVIGFSSSAIGRALHIPSSSFGVIFSAGTLGTLCGAIGCGMLADRIGRQRALMICTAAFGALTLLTPFARTATELVVLRFLAGAGLGGAMPAFLTIVSEYSPRRYRAMATGLLWCGYPIGGTVGGLIGSMLVPDLGWKAMFYLGGSVAMLIMLSQAAFLPESLHFLVLSRRRPNRVLGLARQLDPLLPLDNPHFYLLKDDRQTRDGLDALVRSRTAVTLLLWAVFFFTFVITNFFVLWAPLLLRLNGLAISTAALMVALNNMASIPSEVAAGWLIDRGNAYVVVAVAMLALVGGTLMLAMSLDSTPVVALSMLLIGFMEGSAIAGVLSLVTSLYPSEVRSTAVGWAVGFGRLGQVVSSLVIGWTLSQGATPGGITFGMCLPPLIACACVVSLLRRRSAVPEVRHV